ncbi:pyruvate kinase [Azospirillum brasilense]|uniref:Pyruvate kinase n=3 Tax=Azospirillum TaxID=191 RepID=A0A560AJW4_AZOBR|nr:MULTISPECIES: pyruvate kinase [Azospirillum]AIB11853.1 pyruvate kinase [Azospirillum argentinense]EZQ08732.1 pyruvate kinase [Azospirillum argentinense]KAA1052747.1 Pyruvate kinase [Azospirillum argentinense]MBB3268104.1 pyruvate kinase [Azospirillum sp. OGB3]MBK3736851.1 pyruvate kinase [Azospirillum brasilense]
MQRNRSTKIVATLGPASSTYSQIFALAEAGVDVFRLNASHGTQRDHAERYRQIRAVEETVGRPIGVLLDLQGPKLRVGTFKEVAVILAGGDRFRLDLDPTPGDRSRVCVPHPEIFASLEPGHELLLNDGRMRLRVLSCGPDHAETEVMVGGTLSDRKGMNVPGTTLALSALSEKDRSDLQFGLTLGVDWIGLSFVQRPEDILEARALIGDRAHIMTKVEKPAALPRLEEIIALSDAVMVARGDLGVELPPEDVPGLQKRMIRLSRAAGKPVIVATQMLESMITEPTPTRAEASDVATAVYDGSDAVMLSAESASGKHPVEAVAMMDRIIRRVERDPLYRRIMDSEHPSPEATTPDALSAAARQIAETISAAGIATFTSTGSTARRASRERPTVPILGLSAERGTARLLSLAWGVHPVWTADVANFAEMVERASLVAAQEGIGAPGQSLIVTAGVPFGTPGTTNSLRVVTITANGLNSVTTAKLHEPV